MCGSSVAQVKRGVDLEELKARVRETDLGISEADIEKVQQARKQREQAKIEKELENSKMKAIADIARIEFEEKQKNKNKFKPKGKRR